MESFSNLYVAYYPTMFLGDPPNDYGCEPEPGSADDFQTNFVGTRVDIGDTHNGDRGTRDDRVT